MHLIHIDLERGWRGGQRQVLILARELADHGVEQTLLCRRGSPYVKQLASVAPGVGVITTPSRLRATIALPRPHDRLVVYHAHSGNTVPLALLGAWRHGDACVVTRRLDLPVNGWLFRRADRVVAISPRVRAVLLEAGLEPDTVPVIPSAIDRDRDLDPRATSRLRASLGLDERSTVGLTVGALVDQKDPMTLVRALPHLPDDYVHVWVGAGELYREASLLAEYLGVDGRLHLLGFDPEPDRWFGVADVFVLPSIHEGLGSVLLDALHFGVPVVTSDIVATAELIEHDVSGVRFPPGRPKELAAAVARVLAEPTLAARLVREGRRRVADYDIRDAAQRYLELYRSLA